MPSLDPHTENEELEEAHYVVEKVLHKRWNEDLQRSEYWVKWEGYSSKQNTWELQSHFDASVYDQLAEFD